jgi:hypothetical protein
MRVVYGAGAVAAVSMMAAGLVQPDWSSTADPIATDDIWQPTDGPAIGALPGTAKGGQADPTAGKDRSPGGRVRHVTRYVYLKPGQTAPPGATVISPTAPPSRVPHNHPASPAPTATPRPNAGGGGGNNAGGNNAGGNNGGGSNATPRPTPRPTRQPAASPPPTPRPTPKPTPKTRQSGHP